MRHNGVAFPPEYQPNNLQVDVARQRIRLTPLQEEMLMEWAKKLETPYVQDPVFKENFQNSLREASRSTPGAYDFADATLDDIDFSKLKDLADEGKLANMSEEKRKRVSAERKKLREDLKARFGHATVDGIEVEVGAYLVEPPGIFMGRGQHPLRGKWKPRVYPEDVELNLDKDAEVFLPQQNGKPWVGHQWKDVVHEHDGLWIARWRDVLADKMKYVWLAETSHLRQEREQAKYDKASHLETSLPAVRRAIRKGMSDRDEHRRKVATVAYLIDTLAMRVGDEKDEDEADTVGASTLRVEHIQVRENEIEFDFLGKDSVRWEKTLRVESDESRKLLKRNLTVFTKGKQPDEQIFHDVNSAQVNRFLGKALPGLTAKVFRTYHATTTVKGNLPKRSELNGASAARKNYAARLANLEAAIMCNHKRTPPKNWQENLAKREQAVEKLRQNKPDPAKLDAQAAAKEKALVELLAAQKKFETESPRLVTQKEAALNRLEALPDPAGEKEKAALEKKKKVALKAVLEANKKNKARAKAYRHRIEKAKKAIEKAREERERADTGYAERLEKAQLDLDLAKRTLDYNLNTSLKNYIDPRVYQRWGKSVGYDWTRLYTTALRRKFKWAEAQSQADEEGETRDASGPMTVAPEQPPEKTNAG